MPFSVRAINREQSLLHALCQVLREAGCSPEQEHWDVVMWWVRWVTDTRIVDLEIKYKIMTGIMAIQGLL